MNKKTRVVVMTLMVIFSVFGLIAAEPMDGKAVMWEVYNRDSGDTMSATLTMTLTSARGAQRERSIAQYRMDSGGVERKLMFFLSPNDVKNTSFLSISYEDGKADDQFIYLPALKRTKRIASDNKNDSFMGSDFTYDDMGSRHPDLDTHTILRRETVQGVPTIVVQSESKSAQEYPKTISWIVDGQWYGMKKEFYDKSGKLAKTLVIDEIKTVDGIHIIGDMTMSNLTKRTSTRIRMDDVRFDVDLDERFFSERQMQIGPRR
ncbi:MAG: outer membrane lipoprotein-sorting protein [Sphaerochaeta sp.]|jgi:hypothetical protein